MTGKTKEYYSSREAAEILGVAVSTIQKWTDAGVLKAWTTGGGHRRISCESVEEILNQQHAVSGYQDDKDSLSVIVVEDDAQLRKLYKKYIKIWDQDAQVILAKDGYEGLIKVGQSLPDIIITDLMMPNIDGFQMVKVLKEIPELKDCRIIVISGLEDTEILKRGGLPEGIDFIRKPVPYQKLYELFTQESVKRKQNTFSAVS